MIDWMVIVMNDIYIKNYCSKNHSISTCLRSHIPIKEGADLAQQRGDCYSII